LLNLKQNCPKRIVIVAPTGVAAINASGVTIHSFFQLPFSPFIPQQGTSKPHRMSANSVRKKSIPSGPSTY
jgi:hypothetical protein